MSLRLRLLQTASTRVMNRAAVAVLEDDDPVVDRPAALAADRPGTASAPPTSSQYEARSGYRQRPREARGAAPIRGGRRKPACNPVSPRLRAAHGQGLTIPAPDAVKSFRATVSNEKSPTGVCYLATLAQNSCRAHPPAPLSVSTTTEGPASCRALVTSNGSYTATDPYIIPLMSGMPPPAPAPSFSGTSATIASVVRMFLAIEAAFCRAERVTIAGSMMPSATRSTIWFVPAFRPWPFFALRTSLTTTEPSRPAFSAS